MVRVIFELIALHLLFGAAWIGLILLLPDHPDELLIILVTYGGGVVALLGPAFLLSLRK